MKTRDFYYELPKDAIAQHPLERRDASKLMVLYRDSERFEHHHFSELQAFLREGDVLVINDTKVIPARIFGRRQSGARVEFLLLEAVGKAWKCLVRPARKAQVGDLFDFGPMQGRILETQEEGIRLVEWIHEGVLEEILDAIGTMPLPPYIQEELVEQNRYQTIYADERGSAAAPTAGLHFTEKMLLDLEASGIEIARLTLHVGLGTFRPVKSERIEDHPMHSEWYRLDEENAAKIQGAKRVVAVGTTSVRTLESIHQQFGEIRAHSGRTSIFIYPGYQFRIIDALITNFHLPESTLLMLVSAFCSRELILRAYAEALNRNYRFFSFGDAMLITKEH